MRTLEDLGSSESQVLEAYDETVRDASPPALAAGLSEAFRSSETPPFEQMVTGLYRQSNPAQKAGLINQVLAAIGTASVAQVLPTGWIRSLPGVLRGAGVTPAQATRVSPEEVEILAAKAASKDSRIPEKVADFYAHHPALVRAIGAGALALVLSSLSRARR